MAIDPGYPGASALGRLDGFLAEDGSACWFVELNLELPAGIGYDEAMVEIVDQLDITANFATPTARGAAASPGLAAASCSIPTAHGAAGRTPTIAIV